MSIQQGCAVFGAVLVGSVCVLGAVDYGVSHEVYKKNGKVHVRHVVKPEPDQAYHIVHDATFKNLRHPPKQGNYRVSMEVIQVRGRNWVKHVVVRDNGKTIPSQKYSIEHRVVLDG